MIINHGIKENSVMGWWQIINVESGMIDWDVKREGKAINAIPGKHDKDQLYNGDGPADVMGPALDKINELYIKAWGRPAKREELQAVFNFCANGMFD